MAVHPGIVSATAIIPGFWSWKPKKDQEFETRFGLIVSFEGYLSPCLKKVRKEKKWQFKSNEGGTYLLPHEKSVSESKGVVEVRDRVLTQRGGGPGFEPSILEESERWKILLICSFAYFWNAGDSCTLGKPSATVTSPSLLLFTYTTSSSQHLGTFLCILNFV